MAFINSADLQALQPWAPVIAASIAAGVGAWVAHKFGRIQEGIARQQAETAAAAASTARKKLKLDLFDRRWAMYQVAVEAIKTTRKMHHFSTEVEIRFLDGIKGAKWIFNDEVADYLHTKLGRAMLQFQLAADEVADAPSRFEKSDLAELKNERFRDFVRHAEELDKVFAPFLQLEA
ncbi:hypothetical protein LGR64_12260 [Delftia sp. Lp-1]|uniref:hypothetical protein n=1 Tax=Delftia sp. Lp-1 TaxID=682863 RepID=UPI001E5DBEEF|nr:hypothetical protein [Delftia sp. Lp-1]MCB4787053.1 hypothetical protein [Delftia sp. Lp-1]